MILRSLLRAKIENGIINDRITAFKPSLPD